MKRWLRNLALGLGVAAAGVSYSCNRSDNTPKNPDISVVVLDNFGDKDHREGKFVPLGDGRYSIKINKSSIDETVEEMTSKWDFIDQNSRFEKGDKRWSAASQMTYSKLKDIPASQRAFFIYEQIKNANISHESDHIHYLMRNDKSKEVDLIDLERLAMLNTISENLFEMINAEALSNAYISNSNNSRNALAGYLVVRDLMNYFKKDNKYNFYHMPDFENQVKKASKELYADLKKKKKLDY